MFRLMTTERWSGGGAVVISNLRFAARHFPEVLTEDNADRGLVARNVVPAGLLRRGNYVLMPQSAFPWLRGPLSAPERSRLYKLRLATEVSMNRAEGIIRLSSAIPSGRSNSPIIGNVLDEDFEKALRALVRPPISVSDYFVCLGSINSFRNASTLVEAYRLYRVSGGRRRLLIAGPAEFRGVYGRVCRQAYQVEGVTIRAAKLSRAEVTSLLGACHAAVFPSRVEASPITFIEALAITPRIACSDILGHRDTAAGHLPEDRFFNSDDAEQMARALLLLDDVGPTDPPPRFADPDARRQSRIVWASEIAGALRALSEGRSHARNAVL